MQHEGRSVPRAELERRWARCRDGLEALVPQAGGLLVFSRLNIFYLSGTYASGVFWLPAAGEPALFVRKAPERARLESALERVFAFRSFRDLETLCAQAGAPLPRRVAAEMNGLSWSFGLALAGHLPDREFLAGDRVLARSRSVKSPWEMERLRAAGAAHARCLRERVPSLIAPGMTEREISLRVWEALSAEGNPGPLRMENYGEEIFLGKVAVGDHANYPNPFDGPVSIRGEHPATPHMGSAGKVWERGEPLICDVGFVVEGYHTDKTQVYWAGREEEIPARVRAAHGFCIEVQAWLAERLRPGSVPSALAAHCFAWAEREGWVEGFMGVGGNKVRFVAHGIGLAVDEFPVLARGFDDPLEAGMVLAVEPKVGLAGVGMVGVENTFEVTPAGGRSLTGGEYGIIPLAG